MAIGSMQLAVAAGLLCLLTGCAYSYVGADGSRNVIGLVHVSLPPDGPVRAPAESIRFRALGFSLTRGDAGGALSLGYSDTTLAYVRENTCVRWPIASPTGLSEGRPQ